MLNLKKSLFGLAALAVSASVFANASVVSDTSAMASRVDYLHINVVGEYPSISLASAKTASKDEISIDYHYQHSDSIDFYLTSTTDDSEEIFLGRVEPNEELAGSASFKLDTTKLEAKDYILTAKSSSDLGYSEDSISFSVAPEKAVLASASVSSSVLKSIENAAEAKAVDNSTTSSDRVVSGTILLGLILTFAFSAIKKLKSTEQMIREDQLEFVDKALA